MKRKKVNKHKFNLGGLANTTGWNQIPLTGPSATPLSLGQTLKTSLGGISNISGGLANAGVTAFNSIINPSGNSTDVGKFLSGVGSAASFIPGVGGVIGAGVNAIGGLWNAAFGSNLNEEFIKQTEANIKAQNNYVSKATNTTDLLYDWINHDDLDLVSQDDVGSDGWFSDKAKNKTNELNREIIDANARAKLSLVNTNNNIQTNQLLTALANYKANGGPIHIKKANRGKFTKYCGGKVTSECIARGKRSSDPAVRKRAVFADNARGFKHGDGGPLNPYSAESLVNAIYDSSVREEFLGKPSHNYDFTQSEEWADSHGYLPDSRGHRDDRVKKSTHPTHPSRGNWVGNVFNLTNKGIEDPNYILFGMNDGGQDPQAIMSYEEGIVLPETTITPESSYINNSYDNTHIIMKRKKAFGGDLHTHGAEWNNGVTYIGNGGTHEENPFEGVQMGIAPDGLPNLVEEGEVIFNDYVFSNRMTADKDLLDKFKLPKSYDGYSFAAIAEKLGKESKERPNDPISKRGLMSSMTRLQQAQETMRQKGQVGQEGKEYAHGGKMGILFDGLGDYPNSLGDWQDFGVLDTPITVDELESMMSKTSNPVNKNRGTNKLTYLRYAPILGSAIGLGYNIFKKPDYSGPDAILEAAEQVGNYTPVDYTPIGNYLTYKPLDRDYYTNKLNAQSGATRRAILNTTSPSRNAALLAADYNAQTKLGDLFRQAEEYNLAQRERVEGFNRQTNMANSEMGLKASMANQEAALKAKSQRLSGVAQAYAMRDAIDSRRGASISANLTNLFDSLGSVGKEEFIKDMIENNPSLLYNWMGTYKDKKKSKGGYLTVKKRGK